MRRTVLALTAVLAALLVPFAGAAGAGGTLPEFDYTPQSGPPGTVITASGDCSVFEPTSTQGGPDEPAGDTFSTATVELSGPSGVLASTTVDQDDIFGTWEAQLTVPEGTPAGTYDLDAWCTVTFQDVGRPAGAALDAPAGNGDVFPYATEIFTVTAQPTSTTAAPTSSTAAPTSTTRPAVAAQAVRTSPSFTG